MKRFLATLICILGLVLTAEPSLSLATGFHEVLPNTSLITANELLVLTNQQRSTDGLAPLSLDARLSQAAAAKATNMVTEDYWAHYSPSGKSPWSFITATGYKYRAAGENLAYGFTTAAETMTAWMNSPEHRANVLDTNYSDIGFAVIGSRDFVGTGPETIVVAEYGQPVPSTPVSAPQSMVESAQVSPTQSLLIHTATPPKPVLHSVHRPVLSFLARLISGYSLHTVVGYQPLKLIHVSA